MIVARRSFLRLGVRFAGSALLFARTLTAGQREKQDVPLVDQVPPLLDHVLLGCSDLQRGIDFVEEQTGVRATLSGVHPGRGTQNALLSLGTGRYLEVIAPDPAQEHVEQFAEAQLARLKQLSSPRLVGWAVHPRNLEAVLGQLRAEGIDCTGPLPGSRKRPDGKVLHWKTLNLKNDMNGLLPFFIEWSADSPHPSTDAPSGCQLIRLELLTPDPAGLAKLTAKMSLEVPIAKAAEPQLHAVLRGTKNTFSITS